MKREHVKGELQMPTCIDGAVKGIHVIYGVEQFQMPVEFLF